MADSYQCNRGMMLYESSTAFANLVASFSAIAAPLQDVTTKAVFHQVSGTGGRGSGETHIGDV